MPRVPASTTRPAPRVSTGRTAQPEAAPPTGPARGTWATGARGASSKSAALGGLEGTLVAARAKSMGPATLSQPTIAGVPVKQATVLQYTGLVGGRPEAQRGVEVSFGKLSQAQFDALAKEFGGQTRVRYDAAREYGVVDFLPPAVQGLVGKDLDAGGMVELKGTEELAEFLRAETRNVHVGATPNCHGTAWEMVRAYQGQASAHVQLGYGDAMLVGGAYEDHFKSLGVTPPGKQLDFSRLKAGDVVTVSTWDRTDKAERSLLHSAIYVGGGLFFEKPDTEADTSETPYRLVTLEQMTGSVQGAVGREPLSLHARRPKAPLAPLAQQFASPDAPTLEAALAKQGKTVGKPLVMEYVMGAGGGIQGAALSAVLPKQVGVGADGRGVLR